jgi:hypothetical protein
MWELKLVLIVIQPADYVTTRIATLERFHSKLVRKLITKLYKKGTLYYPAVVKQGKRYPTTVKRTLCYPVTVK